MREPTWRNWPEVGSRSSCLILKDIAMPKKLSYWILLGLMMISFSHQSV